jgi:hypothetical protein
VLRYFCLCGCCVNDHEQGQLVCKGCGAAPLPRKLEKNCTEYLNKFFVRVYVHSLKEYELINFTFNYL